MFTKEAALSKAHRNYVLTHRYNITAGKNMIASKGNQFTILNVSIGYKLNEARDVEYTLDMRATDIPESAFSRHFVMGKNVLFDGSVLREFERSTKDIIAVNFNVEKLGATEISWLIDHNRDLVVAENGMIVVNKPSVVYTDCVPVFANGRAKTLEEVGKLTQYRLFYYVPSSLRKFTAYYYNTETYTEEQIEKILLDITGGSASKLVGKEATSKEITKLAARVGLLGVGGIYSDYDISTWGVVMYMGKFGGTQERTDGGAKVAAELVADKCHIGREEARTQFAQMRNLKTSKVAASVEYMEDIIRFVGIASKDLDAKIIHVPDFETLASMDDSEVEGNLVWVGNPRTIGFLSDLNGFKNIPKCSDSKDGFCILNFSKQSKMHTNLQFLQFTQDYSGFVDLLYRIGKNHIKNSLSNLFKEKDYVQLDTGLDKLYIANILPQISKETMRQGFLARGIESGKVKGLNKAIERMHFDLDGAYLTGTAAAENWTCAHESELLHDDEIFVNDKKFWNKDARVMRNPRSHSCETFPATIVSLDTIIERLYDGDFTEDERAYYASWYSHMSPNVVVTPGSKRFKDSTGGSDFDFDGFAVCVDQEFIKMLDTKKFFSVDIVKSDSKGKKVLVESIIDMMQESFLMNVANGNSTVSAVAVENSRVQTILNCTDPEIKTKVCDYLCRVMVDDFNDEIDPSKVYRPHFTDTCKIGDNTVKRVVNDFLVSPKNETVVSDFLGDCSVMFISVIGRIIDAAKTGEKVYDPFVIHKDEKDINVLSCIHQMFRDKKEGGEPFASVRWDNKEKKFRAVYDSDSFTVVGEDTEHFYLADNIFRVQVKLVKWCANLINGLRKKAKPTSLDKEKADARRVLMASCIGSLKELDKTSSDVNRINLVSDMDSRAAGGKLSDAANPYIADMARFIMTVNGVAPEDRFESALCISDLEKGSSFAYNLLKEETLHYALSLDGAVTVMREYVVPCYPKVSIGTQIFVNGRSDTFLCTSDKYNGTFEVLREEDTGRYYFESDLRDLIQIPEPKCGVIFRANTKTKEEQDAIVRAVSDPESSFFVTSHKGDLLCRDAIWVNKNGEAKQLCRIQLAYDIMAGIFHRMEFSVDDVVKDSFFKENKSGGTIEINSVTFMGKFTMTQYGGDLHARQSNQKLLAYDE